MPGPLLVATAQVMCLHGGKAQPLVPNPRVLASGQPIVTVTSPYVIAGCPLPPVAGGPCVTGMFVMPALRVFASAMPVLLLDSQGICAPTGVPLLPVASPARAIGS